MRRRRLLRFFGWTLGLLALGLVGFYQWQPLRYDFITRKPPQSNPWTDPDSARLFRQGTRIAIVTAHPDDSEFYLAGLLPRLGRAGAEMTLIVLTDGDKGYYPFGDDGSLRETRRREQTAAAKAWGARDVVYFGYRDGRLPLSEKIVDRLTAELRRLQPEYVFILDGDYPPRLTHLDHRRGGQMAERAVREAGIGDWLVRFSTIAPNFAIDVTAEWPRRWELLWMHRSQFVPSRQRIVRRIITRNAVQDGKLLGVPYAEGLRVTRLR